MEEDGNNKLLDRCLHEAVLCFLCFVLLRFCTIRCTVYTWRKLAMDQTEKQNPRRSLENHRRLARNFRLTSFSPRRLLSALHDTRNTSILLFSPACRPL